MHFLPSVSFLAGPIEALSPLGCHLVTSPPFSSCLLNFLSLVFEINDINKSREWIEATLQCSKQFGLVSSVASGLVLHESGVLACGIKHGLKLGPLHKLLICDLEGIDALVLISVYMGKSNRPFEFTRVVLLSIVIFNFGESTTSQQLWSSARRVE